MLRYVILCILYICVMLCYVYIILCYVLYYMLFYEYYVMLCYVMLCYKLCICVKICKLLNWQSIIIIIISTIYNMNGRVVSAYTFGLRSNFENKFYIRRENQS